MEGVIPVSVEAVPAHRQGVDLGVGDLDPGVAGAGVEFGLDPEPGAGSHPTLTQPVFAVVSQIPYGIALPGPCRPGKSCVLTFTGSP